MIDPSCRIFGNPRIDPSARVDAFCVITGDVTIGRRVHVGAGCQLFGGSGRIICEDFSGLSPGVRIFTATDNFASGALIGPCFPVEFRDLLAGDVRLEKFSAVGCGSTLMPGVTVGWGAAVGAHSLVRRNVPSGEVWFGVPAKRLSFRNLERLRRLEVEIEARLRQGAPTEAD